MAQERQFVGHDFTYSDWHRRYSIGRYVSPDQAMLLAMIDVDCALWVEYDDATKIPVALIETAREVNQHKTSTVLKNLARMSGLPALVALYKTSERVNPFSDHRCDDIESFRVKRIYPAPQSDWVNMTPREYAQMLVRMRAEGGRVLENTLLLDLKTAGGDPS